MNIRKIPIRIENEYVKGAGVVIGASGSHDDVALKIHYGEMWEGLSKSIVWKDATRGNAVTTLLASNMLDDEGDYIVPVPNEPKAYPGEIFVSFKGYQVSGGVETAAVLTAVARFTVLESEWDEDAEASQAITPSAAEQLQANKQDKLTWDSTPTSGSSNPVTSDGIYRSLTESGVLMKKLDYDSTGTGNKVDTARNAEKLDGQSASYYGTQSEVSLNTAARHTHANKDLLDSYTNSNADITDAISKEHTHANKDQLDDLSALLAAKMSKSSYDTTGTGNKVDTALNAEKVSNKTVVTTLGNDDTTIPTSKAVNDAMGRAGYGDMLKSAYDTTGTGNKVDTALNAEKLNGESASYYAKQSDLDDLEANIYTKTETDSLLDEKADADTVYTKSEVDAGLALKADASNVYTKTESDAALSLKVDASAAVRGDIPQTAQTDVWRAQARDNIGLGFFSVVNGALCITYEEA